MNKTVLWFDADGVLLDFYTPFKDFIDVEPEFQCQFYDMRDMPDYSPNIPIEESIMNFIQLSDEYAKLNPLALLTHLEALKNCGFELRVITQCPTPESRLKRIHNLTMHYGAVFSGIHFTHPGECKVEALNRITSELPEALNILIEDSPSTLVKAAKYQAGLIYELFTYKIVPVCIKHSYNVNELAVQGYTEKEMVMCDDVQELTELLLGGLVCRA